MENLIRWSRLRLLRTTLLVACLSCAHLETVERKNYEPGEFYMVPQLDTANLSHSSPFLKVHMRNGDVYILERWSVAELIVTGYGCRLDAVRDTVAMGDFVVGVDSVAIIETNVVSGASAVAPLAFMTGVTAGVGALCLTNPKACFGSCPTFYLPDEDRDRPRAEGFSSSITPSLEAADVDDLRRVAGSGERVDLEMRNEALETHVVRHADVIAVPRAPGHRTLADAAGRFWNAAAFATPTAARGPEGDCLELVARLDGRERRSDTDSTNLGAHELVVLEFAGLEPGRYGAVIGCRQSLLTTFLLYQTYAYMGRAAGYWIAEIERGHIQMSAELIARLAGCIEVRVEDGHGVSTDAGEVCEFGPIATDVHVVPIAGEIGESVRVTLDMTRGNWRLDWVGLARLEESAAPVRIRPEAVWNAGEKDSDALDALLDPARAFTTLPGDRVSLTYRMPGGNDEFDLFLETRGYYLEWIREEWVADESPTLLMEMFMMPDQALVRLAPAFKRVEGRMEEQFWSSRYAKP